MGAVGFLIGHELRLRWRSIAGLALLVGLAGAMVLAPAAGARRTASAYERFVSATATRDASVQIDTDDPGPILEQIEALEIVARSGRAEIIPVLPTDESLLTDVDLAMHTSPDGRWTVDIDRPLVLRGRMPVPTATDEVLLNELAARQTGLDVGDRLPVATFTPEQLLALHEGGPFQGFGGPEVNLEVVGIGRQATDLQGADIAAGGVLVVSPALHRQLDGRVGSLGGLLSIELAPGATVADLRDEVRRIVGPDGAFDVRSGAEEFGASTREATQVLARALAAFAAVAAVAGAVAVGGSLSRQCALSRTEATVLAAVGCDRRQVDAVTAAAPAAGVLVGIGLAVVAAVSVSGRFPISVARVVEPDPGFRFDPLVVVGGVVAVLSVAAVWLRANVRRRQPTQEGITRRSRVPLALPPSAAVGVGHAFDRRGTARSVPVRAALAAAVLGVVGVVGSATVVRSFDALVSDPFRYGWSWSAEPDLYTDDPEALVAELTASPGVDAVAARHNARLELDGAIVEGIAFEYHHGMIEPRLRSGRLAHSADEVVLGQRTADELGASVGDRVAARSADGRATLEVEVVGIGVIAPVESADPATGAVVTTDGLEALRRSDGFTSLLVRYEPDFDPTALEASIEERGVAHFSVVYARPRLSGGLENLYRSMPIVGALGAFFALLAVLGVGHAIVVGTRHRHHELATLRTLGMRRIQIRTVVAVSALATGAVGLAIGIPGGMAVGRVAWRAIIGGQGVIDAPAVPVVAVAVVGPAAFLVALLLSWRPGTHASRDLASALRSE